MPLCMNGFCFADRRPRPVPPFPCRAAKRIYPCVAWRLIQTSPNVEAETARRLEVAGLETFLPLSRFWCRPAHKRRPILVTRSAFGPYLFCESPYPPVEIYCGHLVHFGDQYLHVPAEEIAKLRATPFVIDQAQVRKKPECGSRVKAIHPVFGSIAGIIISSGGRSALVELDVNHMRVQIPIDLLA
jgi:hypothetical protein